MLKNIHKGQLVSWRIGNKKKCGIVLENFVYWDHGYENFGIEVTDGLQIFKIYSNQDLNVIK